MKLQSLIAGKNNTYSGGWAKQQILSMLLTDASADVIEEKYW